MKPFTIAFHDRAAAIEAAPSIAGDVARFFALAEAEPGAPARGSVSVAEEPSGRFTLTLPGRAPATNLSRGETLMRLARAIGRDTFDEGPGVLLQAGAVAWGEKAVLIVGGMKSGKSALVAWLVEKGFAYLADDNVLLTDTPATIAGYPEPPSFDPGALAHVATLSGFHAAPSVKADQRLLIAPATEWRAADLVARCGLIVDVRYTAGSELQLEPLTSAQAGLRLLEATRKVIIPGDPDHAPVTRLARDVPAMRLTYGNYGQLEGLIDFLARAVIEMEVGPEELARFIQGLPKPRLIGVTKASYAIPPRSDRTFSPKLTIGMATYDDFDGAYFSIQAIRLYHPEVLEHVELVVIDNHPDGVCAEPLKQLEKAIPNYRYIPFGESQGTSQSRDALFTEAGGEFVLCMDCHVFVVPGALRRLLAYCEAHPDTSDLLQGPMIADNLESLSTHFEPVWRAGMFGIWGHNPAADDPDAPPFEIPMQGLGLFACRRAAWPGFNPAFRGFGGEEGYIHEKFRRAGHRTLCLPFLRWMHRFQRPLGVPYRNVWQDRMRNYIIGFREFGLPTDEFRAHFEEVIGVSDTQRILSEIAAELAT